jgi:hypothetical protein
VVIASSARGFAMSQADAPPVISRFAQPLQDEDEWIREPGPSLKLVF